MTVTKGKKKYTFPNSASTSDIESLHLGSASASDTESLHNEANTRHFIPPQFKSNQVEELLALKKCSGRRKLRRYRNQCSLQTLAEEEENDGSLVIVMEVYKSPFAKLLEDHNALEFWNVFIDKSEEEQALVLEAFSKKSFPKKTENVDNKEKLSARISSKVKHTIKVKKNLSLESVKKAEDSLIDFFKNTPDDVYVQCLPTYFERLLLHAIAQYHGLESSTVVENGTKKVKIRNISRDWLPAECFLTDFVADLRK